MSVAVLSAVIGSNTVASAKDGINIFNDVEMKGQLRQRYETISVDTPNTVRGNSFTNRTHLSVKAGLLNIENLSATIGVQSVNNFGYTNYSTPGNPIFNSDGKRYDTVVEKQQAMLSEASLDYKVGKTDLHVGRSQINLDNQRFIGTVGWRQTERSYDTVHVRNNDIENLDIFVAYVYGFAGVVNTTTTETNSIFMHANYKVNDALNITAYNYMLASQHDTIGFYLDGKFDLGAKFDYRAEYAIQRDATMDLRNDNVQADASYFNLDLGANLSGLLVGVNYEVLSGSTGTDGKTNFNPNLGTNHKFNGWADVFYVGNRGPQSGLRDANVRLGYKAKGFGKFLAIYHNFTADTIKGANSSDLGTEINFLYVNKIPGVNGLSCLFKYASYFQGDDANGWNMSHDDRNVAWAQLDYKF